MWLKLPLAMVTVVYAVAETVDAGYCTPRSYNVGCGYTGWAWSCPGATHTLTRERSCGWGRRQYDCRARPSCCDGYEGPTCAAPVCRGGCGAGSCIGPGRCACPGGALGPSCQYTNAGTCHGHGVVDATGRCACDAGWDGSHCQVVADGASHFKVLSINFACRDTPTLVGCDNCDTRFDLFAQAFSGDTPAGAFTGLPADGLASIDVILAQELGTTDPVRLAKIADALAAEGFAYSTGDPGPTAASPKCDDPPAILPGSGLGGVGSWLTGLQNGGLVTFSRHPITRTHAQNWCAHLFPVPAGYLVTHHTIAGRSVVVFNLHAFPQFDFGVAPEDIRTYQFGEVSALATKLAEGFQALDAPYSIVVGGDTNEDAYSLAVATPDPSCSAITDDLVKGKFASIGLDVAAACTGGLLGDATWDPTNNDLARRFSEGDAHEVLDYLVQASTSGASDALPGFRVLSGRAHCQLVAGAAGESCVTDGAGDHDNNEACVVEVLLDGFLGSVGVFATEAGYDYLTIGGARFEGSAGLDRVRIAAGDTFTWRSDASVSNAGWTVCVTAEHVNVVAPIKATAAWTGSFCTSAVAGTLGTVVDGELAHALTDHNSVRATFALPDLTGSGASASAVVGAWDAVVTRWTGGEDQQASCGQSDTRCGSDANCCGAEHSWTGRENVCDTFSGCYECAALGERCGLALGSDCCGYDDFSSGDGMHCGLSLSGPRCALKFTRGDWCVWDAECQSNACTTGWTGRRCE